MPDYYLLIVEIVLLSLTIGGAILYLKQIRKGRREYERAKNAIEDIILSFNRQFRRIGEKLESVAYRVEANSSRSEKALARTGEVERRLPTIDTQISALIAEKQAIDKRLSNINQALHELSVKQETLGAKVADLTERSKPSFLETGIETAIPIRRDKALSPLTETELRALELLAAEGAKTAPEIKWMIKLSREHTARLMKKLYEEGYLERDPSKIPFKYSVKKEMEKFLKKPENGAPPSPTK